MPHVRANGVDLHYELTGPAGAPVIAFAHSIGATMHMWDAQVSAFAGRYRCLRYDTRGHGASEVIAEPATVDTLADDLAGLLDALGIERAHVVGLSLGGMTGQAFALRYPERLDRLALVATSAEMDKAVWRERIEIVKREGYDSFIDVTMVPRWFTPAFAEAHPDVVAGFRARMLGNDPHGYAASANVIATLDLPDRISGITAPTIIIVGADDPATPVAMSERIRSLIPHAEMVVIPKAAHIVAVEQAEVLNGYLGAFLARGDRRDAPRTGGVSFDDGLVNRTAVLGDEHVSRARSKAGDFGEPWQDFITRVAWGEVWGDPTLPWKTRSMLTLAMMTALHREEEFKLHFRAALRNGVPVDELRAVLMQAGIYAGVPATNAAFRWAREVMEEKRVAHG
jgi:3-oxoadipate enol-lactonase/4-carboxymuconolactone decarboxylase